MLKIIGRYLGLLRGRHVAYSFWKGWRLGWGGGSECKKKKGKKKEKKIKKIKFLRTILQNPYIREVGERVWCEVSKIFWKFPYKPNFYTPSKAIYGGASFTIFSFLFFFGWSRSAAPPPAHTPYTRSFKKKDNTSVHKP